MENHTLPTGFRLKNKYIIQKVLGQGGFGISYLAFDKTLDTAVCIKELYISGSSTRGANMTVLTQNMKEFSFADFKERFVKEAMQLARFQHRNIVQVMEYFEDNNTAYMVMEYLNGQTLKEKVQAKGPLSAELSQKIIASILDGVEQIHKAGMLHRDIKPDNLIITNDGRIVLIDFGSARAYSDEKTIAQTAMVSPGYAPLEQYNPTDRKGTFTDIYSIGATFYFMLTGEKPLNVTNRYNERLKAPHEINPNVSMQISSAVMLAMEMKSEDRFQSVGDFRLALQQLAGGQKKKEEQKTVIIPKTESRNTAQNPQTGKKNNNALVFSVIGIFALVLILLFVFNPFFGDVAPRSPDMSEPDTITKGTEEKPSVPTNDNFLKTGKYYEPSSDFSARVENMGGTYTITFKPPWGNDIVYTQTEKIIDNIITLTHYDDYENDNNLKVKILSESSFKVHKPGSYHWGVDWPFSDRKYLFLK